MKPYTGKPAVFTKNTRTNTLKCHILLPFHTQRRKIYSKAAEPDYGLWKDIVVFVVVGANEMQRIKTSKMHEAE